MNIRQRFVVSLLMLMAAANVTFAQTQSTQQIAQTQQTSQNQQTQKGFVMFPNDPNRILPYQLIYELKPGDTTQDTLLVQNKDNFPENLFLYAVDNKGKNGAYDLNTSDEIKNNKLVGKWISLPSSPITLGPGESKILPITITVPPSTSLGDYVGGIALEKRAPAKNYANIMIASRVTLKVNIKVTNTPQKVPKFSDTGAWLQQIYLVLSIWLFIIGILYYVSARHNEKESKRHHGQNHKNKV